MRGLGVTRFTLAAIVTVLPTVGRAAEPSLNELDFTPAAASSNGSVRPLDFYPAAVSADGGVVVGTRYGVMWKDAFFTNRAYFLIDRDGVIRWEHVEETPSGRRENADILAEIAKL